MQIDIKPLLLLSIILLSSAHGGTYWIAASGGSMGDGSQSNPFSSFETALKKTGGGHTFLFKPGYYTGQITLFPKDGGTPQNPTILKSQQKYKAILNGSPGHIIYARENCDWVIIDGFDISGAFYTGVKFGGDYSVVRNCRIHNNALQGIEAHGRNNIVIERNLIEYNGKNPQFDHGIYVGGQNITIRGNIIRFNSSIGIQLVDKAAASVIENNLIYANHKYAIWIDADSNSTNRIINNTIVENRYGICFVRAGKDIVANNIIICGSSDYPAVLGFQRRDINDVTVTNNLLKPLTGGFDSSNFTADPMFLNPAQGLFFLKQDSPAIAKGSPQYAPGKDFFGQDRKTDSPVDLGCYTYNSALLTPQATRQLYLGWAFHSLGNEIPDLWNFSAEK